MYPPFVLIGRICTKTYTFRGTDVTIEPGQLIFIPIEPLQRDPNLFLNPNTFDPGRWRGEKPGLLGAFGLGPRQCLGKHILDGEKLQGP